MIDSSLMCSLAATCPLQSKCCFIHHLVDWLQITLQLQMHPGGMASPALFLLQACSSADDAVAAPAPGDFVKEVNWSCVVSRLLSLT